MAGFTALQEHGLSEAVQGKGVDSLDLQSAGPIKYNVLIANDKHGMQELDCKNASSLHFGNDNVQLPCLNSFAGVLQNWRNERDPLAHGQHLFLEACHYGFDVHEPLAINFIELFVCCGSLSDTGQILSRIVHWSEDSWSSVIQRLIHSGETQQAHNLLRLLLSPNYLQDILGALTAALGACSEFKHATMAQIVHTEIVSEGFEKDVFIGSSLVKVYSKCGLLADARGVFDEMGDKDLTSWSSLMGGYINRGLAEEALKCWRELQSKDLPSSPVIIVYCLRACAFQGCIVVGREICTEAIKEGHECEPFVASALVNVFAKCGSLVEAQDIFDELPYRNVVVWNALMTGYIDQGFPDEALYCYGQMQSQGLQGNAVTFSCCLKACAITEALDIGREIHVAIIKEDHHLEQITGNALVELYVKCRFLEEAEAVFFELPHRDVVSWTGLIAGYAEHGCREKALSCLKTMELDGVSPDSASYVCAMKACGVVISSGLEIHLEIMKRGLENDDCVGNAVVDMYGKCGCHTEAENVFAKMLDHDVISWSALLAAYADSGDIEKALNVLSSMLQRGFSPNLVTYLAILKACALDGAVSEGQAIHMDLIKHGYEDYYYAGNSLVDLYAKCGFLPEARELSDKLTRQDVSWNTLILGYAEYGSSEEVLACFQEMLSHGAYPSWASFLCAMRACGNMGAIDKGREIHSLITKQGGHLVFHDPMDLGVNEGTPYALTSTLIDMYCKCGSIAEAQLIFKQDSDREMGAYNAMMTGYACQGESALVFELLERLKEEGRQPNEITFLNVLNVCSHDGLLMKGQELFKSMGTEYCLLPSVKHHTCMVDLCGRAGQLDKAMAVAARIPSHLDLVVWSSVLGACLKWGSAELASQTFNNAMSVSEETPAMFVLVSNSAYSDASIV